MDKKTRSTRIAAKKSLFDAPIKKMEEIEDVIAPTPAFKLNWKYTDALSFGSCPVATTTSNSAGNNEDMESTMNIGIENNTAAARRSIQYAVSRLSDTVYDNLSKKHMLYDPEVPKTAAGIIEAIKSGNITFPEKEEDCACWDSWRGIKFVKNFKADRCAFEKEYGEFKTEKDALILDIEVLEPKDTLETFKTFKKKWTH